MKTLCESKGVDGMAKKAKKIPKDTPLEIAFNQLRDGLILIGEALPVLLDFHKKNGPYKEEDEE